MNILFLCGHYAFSSAANSICVKNMAEEFAKKGNKVYVLAKGSEYHGEKEYTNGVYVEKDHGDSYGTLIEFFNGKRGKLWRLSFMIIQLVRYMIAVWYFPKGFPNDASKVVKRAKEIIEKNHIDVVVATYMPYDVICAAISLKKENGSKLRVVTYHLDMLTNPNNESAAIRKLKLRQSEKAFRKELNTVDRVVLPTTAPIIDNPKVVYADFPLYVKEEHLNPLKEKEWFSSDTINIAIVGSLSTQNRNPNYFCKLIDSLPEVERKKAVFHIWGKLTDVVLDSYENVIYHGMADVGDVMSILRSSDFLLNIGNAITYKMIPSKIFQIFSAKKPVIFCVLSPEDQTIPYFKRYGHTCFIKEFEHNIEADVKAVFDFITDNYNRQLVVDDKLFESSTPEYVVNKIVF